MTPVPKPVSVTLSFLKFAVRTNTTLGETFLKIDIPTSPLVKIGVMKAGQGIQALQIGLACVYQDAQC